MDPSEGRDEQLGREDLSRTRAARDGSVRPGPPRTSIVEVAQKAEVSIATVSRVVNNRGRVKPELARRVRRVIEETGYLPDTAARSLSSGRSRLLGVIISNLTNPFFPELLQAFEENAVAHGYEVLVASTAYDLQRMATCIDRMLERKVDGVAVMTFGMEEPLLSRFADRGVPLVFMDQAPAGPHTRAVSVDYEAGIHQAVQHLAELGHRRIGFVAGPVHQVSVAHRRAAVERALQRVGLPWEPELVYSGDHSFNSGEQALSAFLALPAPPTAILCSNDISAIGVMHAAERRGLRIPADLSLIGFDGIELGALMMPPLTSVVLSRGEIAKTAVDALLEGLSSEVRIVARPPIGTHLLVRRTTSVPRAALQDLHAASSQPTSSA